MKISKQRQLNKTLSYLNCLSRNLNAMQVINLIHMCLEWDFVLSLKHLPNKMFCVILSFLLRIKDILLRMYRKKIGCNKIVLIGDKYIFRYFLWHVQPFNNVPHWKCISALYPCGINFSRVYEKWKRG